MKIIILDGQYVKFDAQTWDWLHTYGEVLYYEDTLPSQTYERIKDANIVYVNKVLLNKAILEKCPQLSFIQICATGTDAVDLVTAKNQNIIVSNVTGYSTPSVSQHVFAMMLHFTSKVAMHDADVKNGGWYNRGTWCYSLEILTELKDKTIGIIGFGNIAQKVAQIAKAFDMQVVIYNRTKDKVTNKGYQWVSLEQLFTVSDYITLHVPLNKETKHIINATSLSKMKAESIIINTGRGDLVALDDLKKALDTDQIGGAALDVLDHEPPLKNQEIINAKNIIITPHNAWQSIESRMRMIKILKANLDAFLEGNPINAVT